MKVNKTKAKNSKSDKVEEGAEVVEEVSTVEGVEETTEETEEVETEGTEEEETEETEDAEPVAKVKAPAAAKKKDKEAEIPEVVISAAKPSDHVRFACTREINPAPTIGIWNGVHELGVTKMSAGSHYTIPRHIAHVLLDAGAGIIG